MKYKTLFRVLLKVIGVLLIAHATPNLVVGAVQSVERLWQRPVGLGWSFAHARFIGAVIEVALGTYFFFGGKWVVDRAIPSNRPYCTECGYDLTGATRNRCPECGTPFRLEDIRPPSDDRDANVS